MHRILPIVVAAVLVLGNATGLQAAPLANDAFQRTWARTDQPVLSGHVNRTWMWGPEAYTGMLDEAYVESPGGQRTVQYFDKSRMEITDPSADQAGEWYVTNGLLAQELVTGQLQTGNNQFESRAAATVNVAGDADDPTGPTYATMGRVRHATAADEGTLLTERLARDGSVAADPTLAELGVTAAAYDAETNHTIAEPFWTFMRSTGTIWNGSGYETAPIFENIYFVTGRPITEAYWANVKVGGNYQDVLLQCFERRCLTYTPGNDPGWQVEAGNVGQHYYEWRYGGVESPTPTPTEPPTSTPAPPPTSTETPSSTPPPPPTATEPPPPTSTPQPTPTEPPSSTTPPTPPSTPTPPPTPPQQTLPEPIFVDAWLNPIPSVVHAFGGNASAPFTAAMAESAFEIRGLYNLATVDLGYWNHDTRGFAVWLEAYAAEWYVSGGSSYLSQLAPYAHEQMMIGIYDPSTRIGQRIREIEAAFEFDAPGNGSQAYWLFLVGPAMHAANVTPMSQSAILSHWNQIVIDYNYERSVDSGFGDFGSYLSSIGYGLDGGFWSQ